MTAEQLEALGVRVKPLEWDNGDLTYDETEEYAVWHDHLGWVAYWDRQIHSHHKTRKLARAACQADYESRILAALEAAT